MSVVVLITVVVLALIALEILFQLLVLKFSLPIFEHRPPIGAELFPPVPGAEEVKIVTKDGVALAGSLLASRRESPQGVILFCHELDSNRWSAIAYCEGLLAAGFHVLTFDFRNQGESQSLPGYQALHWPSELEVADTCAAVAFIDSRPDLARLPLGIFGISRGGGVALATAAQCDAIGRVASDGAYCCNEMLLHFTNRWGRLYFPDRLLRLLPRWHVQISLWLIRRASEMRRGFKYANVERALSQLRHKRVLMISGERDTYAFPESTRNLHARLCHGKSGAGRSDPGKSDPGKSGHDESTIWIVPAAKHNMARQADPLEYDRRLVGFFSAPASPSADCPSVDCPSVDCPSVDCPSVDCPSVDCPSADCPSADCSGKSSVAPVLNDASSNDAAPNDSTANDSTRGNSGSFAVNGNARPVLIGDHTSRFSAD